MNDLLVVGAREDQWGVEDHHDYEPVPPCEGLMRVRIKKICEEDKAETNCKKWQREPLEATNPRLQSDLIEQWVTTGEHSPQHPILTDNISTRDVARTLGLPIRLFLQLRILQAFLT